MADHPSYTARMDILIVYCTLPTGEQAGRATEIARALVEEGLAACVNLIPQIRSFYRWRGEVHADAEQLAIIKTTAERFEALRARLVEMHPYECPEVVAVPVAHGHADYLHWVREMTGVA
jgi:periplasmic divalent cation tolerance protein